MSVHRLTIAVPVYNESERVGPALKELLSTSFPVEVEILIVDDGSVDGTAETIAALPLPDNVHLIKHERNRGKGAALRTALAEATGDVFVPFDADLEYQASDLVRCLESLIAGGAARVYGRRGIGAHPSFNFVSVVADK